MAAVADTLPEVTFRPAWDARVSHSQEWQINSETGRETTTLRVGRAAGRGQVAVDLSRVRDQAGTGVASGLELYFPLWRRAEGYARASMVPHLVSSPNLLLSGDLLQHLGGGWSVGAGAWRRWYDAAELEERHLSFGHERARWSVRGRGGFLSLEERHLPTGSVITRLSVGDRGSQIELALSAGEEVLDFLLHREGTADVLIAPTRHAALRNEIVVTPRSSLNLGAGYSRMEGYGDRVLLEAGVGLRW